MSKNKKEEPIKPMTPEMAQMANAKLSEYLQNMNFGSVEEMNEFIQNNVVGKRIDEIVPKKKGKISNIEKSDDLMYEAYESSPKKGIKLAKEALALYSENIRALNYLADHSTTVQNASKLYKESIEIGKKQLGEDFFKQNKGHFWLIHETRPFMEAKYNFAICLKELDKTEDAIREFTEILELNPNDNQGVRYVLASALLESKKYDAYFKLYKEFEDEFSAFWLFNYALFLFLTEGATIKTNKALKDADKQNKHVLLYLTRQKVFDANNVADYYSPGQENEAELYLIDNIPLWIAHPETVDWIANYIKSKKK